MTPEQKAKELINKFSPYVEIHKWLGKTEEHQDVYRYDPNISKRNAKDCALLCAEEILKTSASEYEHEDNFWRNVIEELNKL